MVFLAGLMLFISCGKLTEIDVISSNTLTADALKELHQAIKADLTEYQDFDAVKKTVFNDPSMVQQLTENLIYADEFGLNALFKKCSIDPEILFEFDFFQSQSSNENIYELPETDQ